MHLPATRHQTEHVPVTGYDDPPVVRVSGAVKTYRTGPMSFPALRGVDLTARRGEFVGIVGRSGSGKSTLLNLVAGIDRPTAGRIEVAGTSLADLTENRLAAWRGRTVGIVFQFFQLLPTLTVAENVMLPMELSRVVPARKQRERAVRLLDRVGLAALADKLPATLSGGEQQRAAVARALANDPPVLVADEPTGNLDAHTGDAVLDLLGDLAATGTCVLMVTHERDLARWVHRTVTLADGRVVGTPGTPEAARPPEAAADSGAAATGAAATGAAGTGAASTAEAAGQMPAVRQ